jgi:hypothetical protein
MQADVPLAPLDGAHVIRVKVSQFGELLLRQQLPLAVRTRSRPKVTCTFSLEEGLERGFGMRRCSLRPHYEFDVWYTAALRGIRYRCGLGGAFDLGGGAWGFSGG